jgi:hypothetical protein
VIILLTARDQAEREGFEPSMDVTAHTGFRDQTAESRIVRRDREIWRPVAR